MALDGSSKTSRNHEVLLFRGFYRTSFLSQLFGISASDIPQKRKPFVNREKAPAN